MQVRMPHNLVVADVMEDLEGLDSSRLKIHRESQWAVVAARLDTVQQVLEQVQAGSGAIVLVLNDDHEVVGIVNPANLVLLLTDPLERDYQSLEQAASDAITAQVSPDRLQKLRVTPLRVRPRWCSKGEHYVNRKPCPIHP